MAEEAPTGVGLGLRSRFAESVANGAADGLPFVEVAPENYMDRGGKWPALFERVADRFTIITHGLTMSLGGNDPLDPQYLANLRAFCGQHGSGWHSDHLCFSGDAGVRLHDLLPVPFTRNNVQRFADRIRRAQDAVGVPMAVENISFYVHPGKPEMSEAEFTAAVAEAADCQIMLDVNNVYVNSKNFGFDPMDWLKVVPLDRVVQMHVAGHETWDKHDIWVDTHGAPVEDPVYDLMAWVVERTGPLPVVLERDTNIPPLSELLEEVGKLQAVYDEALARREAAASE